MILLSADILGIAIQTFGWIGTVFILYAYFANSQGWLRPGPTYFWLNLIGSIAIILVAWRQSAWQPLAINTFWAIVAAWALAARHVRAEK